MTRPLRLFYIAGEASGDRLGAPLISALRARRPIEIAGVGGEQMEAAGLAPLFPSTDLAVMGLVEVLPRLPTLLRRLRQTVQAVEAFRPDALVTIDSPAFSLRVARRAKAARPDLRTIHYVAPSVWAWRPGRAKEMAAYIDHVLALLPFEPPYMTAAGMTCDFVGHPVAALTRPAETEVEAFRRDAVGEGPLLCLLPGSRAGELRRLADPFREALAALADRSPGLRATLPAAPGIADAAEAYAATLPVPTTVVDPRGKAPAAAERAKFTAMAASDVALAASGTVSLELAALGTPQVIGYRVSGLTAAIARRLLRIDTATLVNLLVDARPVPEFLQDGLDPSAMAEALSRLLSDDAARKAQTDAFEAALAALGRGGAPPPERAADSLLAALD
ncbi:MAG: lipid-A-disaccharide synthase [Pseudomonadota bacterium]